MEGSSNNPARSWAAVVRGTAAPRTPAPATRPTAIFARPVADVLETPVPANNSATPATPTTPTSIETVDTTDLESELTPWTSLGDDLAASVDWPFSSDSVIVCVDVECHCRNQSFAEFSQGIRRSERRVCEVGIAAFDTRDLSLDKAGDRAKEMWPMIKAANLAIIENKHVAPKNHPSWCKVGDANNFNFGKTKWVKKSVVKEEFINHVKTLIGENPRRRQNNQTATSEYRNERNIAWVFFSGSNDEIWLYSLGIDIRREFANSTFHDLQHTRLSRMLSHKSDKSKIGAQFLFARLGFVVSGQHNGGNDAVYELRAFLAELALSPEQWASLSNSCLPLSELAE